jgi:hypothetical protein
MNGVLFADWVVYGLQIAHFSQQHTINSRMRVQTTLAGSTCVICIIIVISLQAFLSTKKRFLPVEGQGVIYAKYVVPCALL